AEGRYLTVDASAYDCIEPLVNDGALVRLVYNNSQHDGARETILGKLVDASQPGGGHRFEFHRYDSGSGAFTRVDNLAADIGYTVGSNGVLYGPDLSLASANDARTVNLPVDMA